MLVCLEPTFCSAHPAAFLLYFHSTEKDRHGLQRGDALAWEISAKQFSYASLSYIRTWGWGDPQGPKAVSRSQEEADGGAATRSHGPPPLLLQAENSRPNGEGGFSKTEQEAPAGMHTPVPRAQCNRVNTHTQLSLNVFSFLIGFPVFSSASAK